MKKFGFGKDNDDDPSRSALFGRKKSSPAPGGDNPYAQASAPANDPYAASSKSASPSPYQQPRPGFQNGPSRGGLPSGGPGGGLPSNGLPSGPRRGPSVGSASTYSQPPPAYSSYGGSQDSQPAAPSGYGADRYGASGGYGDNRYDSGSGSGYGANRYGASSASSGGARGPGGYGNMGRNEDNDAQRDQLFSGAQQRQQQRQQNESQDNQYGQSGQSGGDDMYGGYGGDRQLTEEELEEQEVKHIKRQIQDTRQESINSLSRSIALANQAADTGINTLNILARDEERLNNTERRLDDAATYNKIGAERAKKLKHLNRSMFAVHVNNPFTADKKTAEYEKSVLENHRAERERRDATRKNAWDSTAEMDNTFRDLRLGPGGEQREYKPSAAETNKYVFTDDDDEENAQALEDEATIARQMGELGNAVGMLNRVAKAQTQTVGRQITTADRINEKTDRVEEDVRLNRARLDRIR